MGNKQIAALIEILESENERGQESHVLGSWTISFDKAKDAFVFDKCENEGYCESGRASSGSGARCWTRAGRSSPSPAGGRPRGGRRRGVEDHATWPSATTAIRS